MSWGFDLMDDVHKGKIWEWATRYTLKRSTFFTSDADVTRDKAVDYGMNADKTVVFPWGIDLKEFKPRPSSKPRPKTKKATPQSRNPKSFTIFCNRAWETRYGVDVLARAFVKVAQQNDNVSLILLNGGSQGHVIRDILQKGGALDRVSFGGQVSQTDLPRWYRMADIYVSPSHVDGSSVSLMEALACGLPCLVSDIPANQEWVEDGVNGWLFSDGDVDDLVEKILSAIKKRRSFNRISQAARKTAELKANWPQNFDKLLDTYDKIIKME
jgi:glycosyltransferase involved in cell wall biosynthesis